MKTSNPYTEYRRWLRFIKNDHPKLPPDTNRWTLLAVAAAIADFGDNGLHCYAGNEKIALAGESSRDTVAKYRKCAFEAGWFTDTGRKHGRAPIWDICIPDRGPYQFERAGNANTANLRRGTPSKADSGHGGNGYPSDCPRCLTDPDNGALEQEHMAWWDGS
jgi:hypothetical protein